MKPLNIVFMGSPEFAVPSLEVLYSSPHQIRAVVSNPDKRRGRGGRPVPTDVKKRATELGLRTIDVEDVSDPEFENELKHLSPDLLVVVAFRILPVNILSVPRIGSVNLHASLLPRFRGAAPIHWAVINGEKETGCTVFFLDQKVDTGEIIRQSKTEIGLMETTGDLYARLKVMGAELLLQSVNDIAEDKAERISQDHSNASPAPKLFTDNTRIDFTRSFEDVHNLIRGLNPFPVAWCRYRGEKLNVYRSKPPESEEVLGKDLEPGELINHENRLFVGCGDAPLELLEVQLPGTKRLTGSEFLNGYDISGGLR